MTGQLLGSARPESLLRHGDSPLAIGHRGASSVAPENTLAAFRAAWSNGVQWVEADVQPTADLIPVLFHDDTLERIASAFGFLRSHRLTELATLDAGSWFSRFRDAAEDYSALRIPTMHELLSVLPPDGRVLLEIKGPHSADELIVELAVIRSTRTQQQVWLQSFEIDVLLELRAALPDGWLGLLRDVIDPDPVQLCRDLGLSSYNPEWQALLARPEIVDPLHDAGISVITFTTNHESEWAALTDLGVDGIITDRPADLLAWQRSR